MKVAKLLAGGAVLVLTYRAGKIVGGFKVANRVADELDEVFPGFKKYVAERASEKLINRMFNDPEKEEESQ